MERTSPCCRGTLHPLCSRALSPRCVALTQPPGGLQRDPSSPSPPSTHTPPQAEFRLQEGAPGTLCAASTNTTRKWGGSRGSPELAVRAGGHRQGEGHGGRKGLQGTGRRVMHHSHGVAAPAASRRGRGDTWKTPRCPGDPSWRSPTVHGHPPPPTAPAPGASAWPGGHQHWTLGTRKH